MAPPGFSYQRDLLTADEERTLVTEIEQLTFQEVRMHGVAAKRTVIHYGFDYDYEGWKIHPTDPPPEFLRFVIERSAAAARVDPASLEQLMIARYPAGATIGWHRDAPMFGSPVLGISLISPCTMRFRRKSGDGWTTEAQLLEPRSLYVIDGESRTQWQHSIPKTKELRYSITMRTLRRKAPGARREASGGRAHEPGPVGLAKPPRDSSSKSDGSAAEAGPTEWGPGPAAPAAGGPSSNSLDTSAEAVAAWMVAMRRGDFARAWEIGDELLRLRQGQTFHHLPRHEQPIWDGTPLTGRRVLVRCYHGLGDTIQFARFLPLLKKIAREVVVWAQPSLLELLRVSFDVDELLPLHDGSPGVAYDVDVEIMELPWILRTTLDTLPTRVPYLHVERAPLPPSPGLQVGLAWRAGDWNPIRSVDYGLLAPLLAVDGVTFHALQLDLEPGEGRGMVVDERRSTVLGTAQLIRGLDLVITVDSMPAHLAGALAVPVWTLLARTADWRWMLEREDTPWYPTMRLFRQTGDGWGEVVARVAEELRALARERRR